MTESFGWNYPPGLGNDPHAPWNEREDLSGEPDDNERDDVEGWDD